MITINEKPTLLGLDNVAADGAEAFDTIEGVLQELGRNDTVAPDTIVQLKDDLKHGKRYLKGQYKLDCENIESNVPDHCHLYALSDRKVPEYQSVCNHHHDSRCPDCERLKDTLKSVEEVVRSCEVDEKSKSVMLYDITQAREKIEQWKGHILAVIHQEKQKHDVMQQMNEETAFIIIDFAMKYLPKRYREDMASWFGKTGLIFVMIFWYYG